jgi:hypothetical protein
MQLDPALETSNPVKDDYFHQANSPYGQGQPLLAPFEHSFNFGPLSPNPSEGFSPPMVHSPSFGNNYTYHRDSLSSELSNCPELVYSPHSDPYDSASHHSDHQHGSNGFQFDNTAVNYSDYISSPLPTPEEDTTLSPEMDLEESNPDVVTQGTPGGINSRQFRDGPVYSPSLASSISATPSCSSGSEYGYEFDEEQASSERRSRSPFPSSIGPVRRSSAAYPASPLSSRASPYSLPAPHEYFSRRSSSSSLSAGLHHNMSALGMASPAMDGSPFGLGSPSVNPHFLETQSASAPTTSPWEFDTIKRTPPTLHHFGLMSPPLQHEHSPHIQQGFHMMSPPGFATHLFGNETPFNSPARHAPEAPHSAPPRATRPTRKRIQRINMEEIDGGSDEEHLDEDSKDGDYEEDFASLSQEATFTRSSGSKRSRQGTVKASQMMYSSVPASHSLPDISSFDKSILTPQGTLRGLRMPIAGKNPSTTGAFMPLDTDESYMHLPTKRSRGRRPVADVDLGLDVAEVSASPTEASVEFAGTTKSGKPKKVFM